VIDASVVVAWLLIVAVPGAMLLCVVAVNWRR